MATRSRFDKVNRIDGSHHLVLLCKNETGYKNLIKLVSAGFIEGFIPSPGLIKRCWSSTTRVWCAFRRALRARSRRPSWQATTKKRKSAALYYNDLFGQGNYYLEIQDHGLEEQQVLPLLIRLARETGIPWSQPTTPIICAGKTAKCRAS